MAQTMKALVLTGSSQFELQEVPRPVAAPGEVLVRVKACSVCGSDVHGMDGSSGRRIPPIIMGHEASGVIEALGQGVSGFAVGQRVTFDSTDYCGTCAYCRGGDVNLCDNRRVFGVSCAEYRKDGAFAEYVAVKQHLLYPLPDAVSFEEAAMVEPLAVALHAVGRVRLDSADTAVVIGAGTIGLLVVAALRAKSKAKIFAVDLDAGRLETARYFGADEIIHSGEQDALDVLLKATGDRGVALTFEAVGLPATAGLSIQCLQKGGSSVWVGNLATSAEVPLQAIVTKQLSIFGSCACAGEYAESLDLLAQQKVDIKKLMSLAVPLEEGPAVFKRLKAGEAGLVKAVLTM